MGDDDERSHDLGHRHNQPKRGPQPYAKLADAAHDGGGFARPQAHGQWGGAVCLVGQGHYPTLEDHLEERSSMIALEYHAFATEYRNSRVKAHDGGGSPASVCCYSCLKFREVTRSVTGWPFLSGLSKTVRFLPASPIDPSIRMKSVPVGLRCVPGWLALALPFAAQITLAASGAQGHRLAVRHRDADSPSVGRARARSCRGPQLASTDRRSVRPAALARFLPDGSIWWLNGLAGCCSSLPPGGPAISAASLRCRPSAISGLVDLAVDPSYAENGTIYLSCLVGREEASSIR